MEETVLFDPKLKEALAHVQKPGRYTGGEPGCIMKDKADVGLRWFRFFSLFVRVQL